METQSSPQQPRGALVAALGLVATIGMFMAATMTLQTALWEDRTTLNWVLWRTATIGCLVPLSISLATPFRRRRVLGTLLLGSTLVLAVVIAIGLIAVFPHASIAMIFTVPGSILLMMASIACAVIFRDRVGAYPA